MNKHPKRAIAAAVVLAGAALFFGPGHVVTRALPNGLALTPPMGWNSWNKFACGVNEKAVRAAADAMVASGMRDAGYQYIVIDDCWQVDRDAKGNIIVDGRSFPSGIKALADYVHSKGLKFGIYSDAGTKTCAGRPGSWGYEFQDARQYAEWGVDYLKYDWCNNGGQNSAAAYSRMRDALQACGRPIVFSICEWGSTKPWLWARDIGNLWRTTDDIQDAWEVKKGQGGLGVVQILDLQAGLEAHSGPGHWNDPDMLEVGNGGMTDAEYRTHFSLWCLLAAPLMAGDDLRTMTSATRDILTNKEVIAIDQDPLGRQAAKVRDDGDLEVWARPLADGGRAVILLNRGPKPASIAVNWLELGYPKTLEAKVRDLWKHQDLGAFKGSFQATVEGHGVVMVRLMP
ncbi:MAG TPA: glycoside hydrolase family 27 protein [Burkholderiales bacterium]|nr:glycoside hydrolase family 27 protein [Burkholderiales bacterium]